MSKRIRQVRQAQTEAKYQDYLKNNQSNECVFCPKEAEKRVIFKKYKYWYITKNDFPYDIDYLKSDMLVPVRHFEWIWDFNEEELKEYLQIRQEIFTMGYNEMLENLPGAKTQRHFHQHLLEYINS